MRVRWTSLSVAFAIIVVLGTGAYKLHTQKNEDSSVSRTEGAAYIQQLVQQIESSDRIVVHEHSDFFEFMNAEHDVERSHYREIIYQTIELGEARKRKFINTIRNLDDVTQNAFPACIFVPHHRIEFYAHGKLQSSLEVCFQCGDVDWSAAHHTQPWSIYSGLSEFITGLGMHPKQNWQAKWVTTRKQLGSDTGKKS